MAIRAFGTIASLGPVLRTAFSTTISRAPAGSCPPSQVGQKSKCAECGSWDTEGLNIGAIVPTREVGQIELGPSGRLGSSGMVM